MVDPAKAGFLRDDFVRLIQQIDPATPPVWGKMNVQQMTEHMSDYIRIASGRTPVSIVTDAERLPKMQNFLMSEKPFRQHTPNVLLPDTPPPVKHQSMEAALAELSAEIAHFFEFYADQPGRTVDNPFFGSLNYEQQVQLLYKHTTHHLRQFGVAEETLQVN